MLSFLRPSVLDVIDVVIVALVIYYFIRFLRGSRAFQMLFALLVIFAISAIARWVNLKTLGFIVDSLKAVWVVAFVILFQPEIRNALARLGRYRFLRYFIKPEVETATVDEIVRTTELLKERNLGGLLVFEQDVGLKEYIDTGTKIEARVSAPLLASIFTPPSPLHDGACIIKGGQVIAAGCILPVSDDPDQGRYLGMRHRAGLGITGISDALAVIVSEETGQVSFAARGRLHADLAGPVLRKTLLHALFKEA